MCKIAVIPFIPEGKEGQATLLAKALTPYLTGFDQDGFGYMALGRDGLFGERWLDPEDAWKSGADSKMQRYASFLENGAMVYNAFGEPSERIYGMALHARMATCGVDLHNVHPFVSKEGDLGIIHNGVVTNSDEWKLYLSTCDSEAILQQLDKHDVANGFVGIKQALKPVEGWYAVAAFMRDKNGRWYLDLFKEHRANLYACYVKEIDATVFVTDPEHLKDACEDLKWSCGIPIKVKGCRAIRTDATTGQVLQMVKTKPPKNRWVAKDGTTGLVNPLDKDWSEAGKTVAITSIKQNVGVTATATVPSAVPASCYQDVEDALEHLADDDAPMDDMLDDPRSPFYVGTKRGY